MTKNRKTTGGQWRFIVQRGLEPVEVQSYWHGLAESLEEEPGTNAVLVTTTKRTSLCSGFHQDLRAEVDLGYCERNEIELVRRMAGGGTILLDRNQVFYNVLLHGYGFPSPIKRLFREALKGPCQYYRNLGLDAVVDFNEISVGGRKISGTAAASMGKVGVVLGNIILDFSYRQFCDAMNYPSENFRSLLRQNLERHLTTLKKELGVPPPVEEVISGLKVAFESVVGGELVVDDLTPAERASIREVEDEYRDPSWNFPDDQRQVKTRKSLKVKKGTCIVHYEPEKVDVLVVDGLIEEVLAETPTSLVDLVGADVTNLPDGGVPPEFAETCLAEYKKSLI
ncbi:MAG: lipoate--protein ligase family protein [Promethearchaeota archaeon]